MAPGHLFPMSGLGGLENHDAAGKIGTSQRAFHLTPPDCDGPPIERQPNFGTIPRLLRITVNCPA